MVEWLVLTNKAKIVRSNSTEENLFFKNSIDSVDVFISKMFKIKILILFN